MSTGPHFIGIVIVMTSRILRIDKILSDLSQDFEIGSPESGSHWLGHLPGCHPPSPRCHDLVMVMVTMVMVTMVMVIVLIAGRGPDPASEPPVVMGEREGATGGTSLHLTRRFPLLLELFFF